MMKVYLLKLIISNNANGDWGHYTPTEIGVYSSLEKARLRVREFISKVTSSMINSKIKWQKCRDDEYPIEKIFITGVDYPLNVIKFDCEYEISIIEMTLDT